MSDDNSADEPAENSRSGPVNRRRFVKALGTAGGGAIAGSMFASSTQAAARGQSPTVDEELVTGDELVQLARNSATQEDVDEVMNAAMQETVREGSAVEVTNASKDGIVFTQGSPRTAKENGVSDLSGDAVFVQAAEHTLANGEVKTRMAYLNSDGQALGYFKHERSAGNTNRAILWDIIEDEDSPKLSMETWSVNGEEPVPVSEMDGSLGSKLDGDQVSSHVTSDPCEGDPCGGCHGAPPGGDHGESLQATCNGHIDLNCVRSVYKCYKCTQSCPAGGPLVCAACILIFCGANVAYSCCVDGGFSHHCAACGCGAPCC